MTEPEPSECGVLLKADVPGRVRVRQEYCEWMLATFEPSVMSGQPFAICYSLIESCRRPRIDAWK
jgi:hypothetical protein